MLLQEQKAELKQRLKRKEKIKYLSPAITNEILNDFSSGVLTKLQPDIQTSKYYDIVLDETSDVSGKEQISICFRITLDDLDMQEVYCGFYETRSTTREELFKIVKDVLSRFQLPIDKCRGQCYDSAANVSEQVKGFGKKLIYEESRAIYVYCRARKTQSSCSECFKK